MADQVVLSFLLLGNGDTLPLLARDVDIVTMHEDLSKYDPGWHEYFSVTLVALLASCWMQTEWHCGRLTGSPVWSSRCVFETHGSDIRQQAIHRVKSTFGG